MCVRTTPDSGMNEVTFDALDLSTEGEAVDLGGRAGVSKDSFDNVGNLEDPCDLQLRRMI